MISAWVPVRTYSALNERVHWSTRAARARSQRNCAFWALRERARAAPDGRLRITMTRCAPSAPLDDDNLAGSLKHVRDGVADWIGIDDGDPRLEWVCKQKRAVRWAVEIDIEVVS